MSVRSTQRQWLLSIKDSIAMPSLPLKHCALGFIFNTIHSCFPCCLRNCRLRWLVGSNSTLSPTLRTVSNSLCIFSDVLYIDIPHFLCVGWIDRTKPSRVRISLFFLWVLILLQNLPSPPVAFPDLIRVVHWSGLSAFIFHNTALSNLCDDGVQVPSSRWLSNLVSHSLLSSSLDQLWRCTSWSSSSQP